MNQFLVITLVGGMLLLATACERPETVDISGHMVSVQRLGVHDIVYANFGDRAVLGALHRTVQAGVPKDKIEKVMLTATYGRRRAISGRSGRRRPGAYELWLRIADCDKLVYMRANFNGRVLTVQDKGGCLKPAAGVSLQ